ncbi:hypothetical protein CR513_23940, partial [Mucuna pruriens]
SNPSNLHAYDIEIDRTFHSSNSNFDLANIASDLEIGYDSNSANFDIVDFDLGNSSSYSNFGVDISPFSLDNMTNNDRTFKE